MLTGEQELFDAGLPGPLPAWLPSETLFSLLSRFHVLSGNRLASTTCRALFGADRRCCEHDLPVGLSQLCRRAHGALGAPEPLAHARTLLPFYLPLQPADRAAAATTALSESTGGMLKFRLGLLTSRFRANHPLKACPACMVADGVAWGTPYWHLPHQFPGVWTCPQHGELLLESSVKSTGVGRFSWTLPHTASLFRVADPCDSSTMSALTRLAALVIEWSRPDACIRVVATQLAAAYRARAAEVFGTRDLRPRTRSMMSAAFYESVAPLRVIPELRALPASQGEATGQIQRWLLAPRGGTHPLRHLAIIFWLFDDWAHFWRTYAGAAYSVAPGQGAESAVPDPPDPRANAFLTAVRGGMSVSSAARAVGVAVNTGMAWAARHDIAVHRRPKGLQPVVRNTLIDGLRRGPTKRLLPSEVEYRFRQ